MVARSSKRMLCSLSLTTALAVPPTAWTNDESAAEDSPTSTLQEVFVYAQKRAQSVENVPISLTAISGEDLETKGIQNARDLVQLATNVQINHVVGIDGFNVRGMGTNGDYITHLGSPVASHVDEVYHSAAFMDSLTLFDIDRVEVLKGPQGTIFGRNTTGGAVNFYTRKPSDTLSANASVGYGNYDTFRGELGIGGPIAGDVRGRIAGFVVDQRDGYSLVTSVGKRDGAERKGAIRASLDWSGEATDVFLSAHYGRDKSLLGPYESTGIYTPASVAAGTPVLCPEYLNGNLAGLSNCVMANGQAEADGDPFVSTQSGYVHNSNSESAGSLLRIDHDMGWSQLTSLTAYEYFRRRTRESWESDGGTSWNAAVSQYSQELRLTSPDDGGVWDYVGGLYYERDNYRNNDYVYLAAGAVGFYSPFDEERDSAAAYFHNEIEVAEGLRVIAGARYTWERSTIDGTTYLASGFSPPGSPLPTTTTFLPGQIVAPVATTTLLPDRGTQEEKAPTFKGGLQWNPTEHVMIYGTASTGFRSGGVNAEFTSAQVAVTALKPEKLTAYEVGIKSQLADRKVALNGVVFNYRLKDGFIRIDQAGSILPITSNAGKISTYGAELDARWMPIDRLTLSAGAGWLKSRIKSHVSSVGTDLYDHAPANSPEWTANTQVEYSYPITADLTVSTAVNGSYRSSQYLLATNAPIERDPAYWIVNAEAGIESASQGWRVSVWVKNLDDEIYRTYVGNYPYSLGFLLNRYGDPRTYGMKFTYKY